VVKKEAEENKGRTVELQRMWNVNTEVMRIIVEDNGDI